MEKKLMVVDDSRMSRMMIVSIVNENAPEWVVVEAGSADEALALVGQQAFTAITLDQNMPGRSGLDVVSELQAANPDVAIALFTANVQKSVRAQAEKLGVTFIAKPITEEKVLDFVRQV